MQTLLRIVEAWAATPEGMAVILGTIGAIGLVVREALRALAARLEGKRAARATYALDVAERAAARIYEDTASKVKRAAADGKLDPQERVEMRRAAVETAIVIAREEGRNLVEEVGKDALPRLIDAAVGRLKSRALPASLSRLAPVVLLALVSCAGMGVEQNLPQAQDAVRGAHSPTLTSTVTVGGGADTRAVAVTVTITQDAHVTAEARQAQRGGTTGAVDNAPTASPSLSVPGL